MMILDEKYHVLAEALYNGVNDRKTESMLEMMKMLQTIQKHSITVTEEDE